MTKVDFEREVLVLMDTLYRVSSTILRRQQDQCDAVQSCLLRAWRQLGSLRDEARFKPWLIRILINECYRIHRADRRMVWTEAPEEGHAAPPDTALREAVDTLPERLRLPVVLHYIEGFTVREVAQGLRLPEGTIKTRLHRARALLRQALTEEEA